MTAATVKASRITSGEKLSEREGRARSAVASDLATSVGASSVSGAPAHLLGEGSGPSR